VHDEEDGYDAYLLEPRERAARKLLGHAALTILKIGRANSRLALDAIESTCSLTERLRAC
jgi:hypothetical protein